MSKTTNLAPTSKHNIPELELTAPKDLYFELASARPTVHGLDLAGKISISNYFNQNLHGLQFDEKACRDLGYIKLEIDLKTKLAYVYKYNVHHLVVAEKMNIDKLPGGKLSDPPSSKMSPSSRPQTPQTGNGNVA